MAKRIMLALVVFTLAGAVAWADVPPVMSYQGRLTDSAGKPVSDGTYQITVWLYTSPTATKAFWGPVTYPAAVRGGVFSLTIGDTPPLAADCFRRETFLEIAVNDRLISPRTRIQCVGYAFRAQQADESLSLALPYSDTVSTSADAIKLVNSGGGRAGDFESTYATGTNPALRGYTTGTGNGVLGESSNSGAAVSGSNTGTGRAGEFIISNSANDHSALYATTSGTGYAAEFLISNTTTGSPAVAATSYGAGGGAVQAIAKGKGSAGYFEVYNSASTSATIYGYNNGSGVTLQASNSGTGSAGQFYVSKTTNTQPALVVSMDGTGYAAVFGVNNSSTTRPAVSVSGAGTGGGIIVDGSNGKAVDARAWGNQATVMSVANGGGEAGHFEVTSTSSGASALYAKTIGNGGSPALRVEHAGLGEAGHFEVTKASSGYSAIYAKTVGSAATINVKAGTGQAAFLDGDTEVTGKLRAGGSSGGMIPVAFGYIDANGVKRSGSPNWSCSMDSNRNYYYITIDNVTCGDNTIALVTPRMCINDHTVDTFTDSGRVVVSFPTTFGHDNINFNFAVFQY